MSKIVAYLRQLVGNGKAATIGIFAFIVILCLCFARCHAAEIDLEGGSSFGNPGYGPVLGLNVKQALQSNPGVSVFAGTDLWGSTTYRGQAIASNWDWHLGIEGCKWRFCASIGPDFVHPAEAAELGEAARKRVTWRYHWESCLGALDPLLRWQPRDAAASDAGNAAHG